MSEEIIKKFEVTGPCEIDMSKALLEDWHPKLNKKKTKICRDAFICHHRNENKFTLALVRKYQRILKCEINESQARELIKYLNLKSKRNTIYKNHDTYRYCWCDIDFLENKIIAGDLKQ